jgi:hypothetical protein
MKVKIEDFGVDLDIKSRGIKVSVNDGKRHKGNLYVTMTGLTWCVGKTSKDNGKKIEWQEFIDDMAKRK